MFRTKFIGDAGLDLQLERMRKNVNLRLCTFVLLLCSYQIDVTRSSQLLMYRLRITLEMEGCKVTDILLFMIKTKALLYPSNAHTNSEYTLTS